jgi:hypothetical protein
MSDNLRRYRAIYAALKQAYGMSSRAMWPETCDHPSGPHQWYRGQQECAAAPNRP